jgi:hypothetical protein
MKFCFCVTGIFCDCWKSTNNRALTGFHFANRPSSSAPKSRWESRVCSCFSVKGMGRYAISASNLATV